VSNHDFFADIFAGMEDVRPSTTRYPVQLTLEEASSGVIRYIEMTSEGRGSEPRKLEVKIPPGVDTGSKVRIPPGEGRNRQIYLEITVRPHARFRRSGSDLNEEVEVPLADAVLGSEVAVPTLTGRVMLTIPPETQNGQVFRLSGQGMPHLNLPATKGDLLATVKVVLPKDLNEEERQLFEQFKELRSTRRPSA
jgi:DnaJ-class molecular chaperone